MRYIGLDLPKQEIGITLTEIELDKYLKLLNDFNNDFSIKFTDRQKFNQLLQELRDIKRQVKQGANNNTVVNSDDNNKEYINKEEKEILTNDNYKQKIKGWGLEGSHKLNQYEICSYDEKCNQKATKILCMIDAYNDKKYINPLALCDQHVTQLENDMRKAGMNDIKIFNIDKFKEILSKQHKDISDENVY